MGPQEDYIETVFTCEGDYHDPHLKDRLEDFQRSLKDLLLTDKSKLILKKVEPWNSVRVTFKIPREAAVRLKQLAQQGNTTLKELGVLAVQIQDQNISLTIAGKNNEHTQLVFRTAESAQTTAPSVSVHRTNSPLLEGLVPHGPGPGPSHVDPATSKNIADYIRQLLPGHLPDGQKAKKNNILSLHGVDLHKQPFSQLSSQASHHGIPSSSSPPTNSLSPSQSPAAHVGLKFPQLPNLPPGLPPGLPASHLSALDNLPPPPPYPGEGSAYLNNIQKLNLGAPGTSPLLVNLLKSDPTLSSLFNAGKLGPANWADMEALPATKKKRKPRKPREKKKKDVDPQTSSQSVVPPPVASTGMLTTSMPSTTKTTAPSATQLVNHDFMMKEHDFHSVTQALLHNTSVQNISEQIVPLTNNPVATHLKKMDEGENTAGKIINPVTGLLEPVELSDTSPAKSDGDKHSPRSLAAQRKALLGEDLVMKKSLMAGPQGKHYNPHQIPRQIPEHSDHQSVNFKAGIRHKPFSSSQLGNYDTSGLSQQMHIQESLKNNILSRGKNDVIPSLDKLEQIVPRNMVKGETEMEAKCDKTSAVGVKAKKVEVHKKVQKAQEVATNPIPSQLLNKPLLQVKHNSVLGKQSGSPDSNGDSECSSQGISLDTHNCPDAASQSVSQTDTRSYNTDSGVGSCSERSDDTPSEHGDSDFKSGNTNSYECAKTVGIDTLKQAPPPNSKIMTVGYALDETHKDRKNHKIVSALNSSEKSVNSALNLTKTKTDNKTDMCSTSQSPLLNWATNDQRLIANNVEAIMKRAAHESANRKSPKLTSSAHNSVPHGMDSMQGNSEMTMQKKKTSPRNSPRNPSSPRNPGSPRGGGSPRASDILQSAHGPGRQSFLTNQDIINAHLSARESHSKSSFREGGRSPLLEQRKSPFNMLPIPNSVPTPVGGIPMLAGHLNSGESLQHIGIETMRRPSQCNIDNIALLKSLEAFAGPHMMTSINKDVSLLQKFEELKPLFQKLQNPPAPASTVPNGLENINRLPRSPGPAGPTPKNSNHNDSHSVNSNPSVSINVNVGSFVTTVFTSSSNVSSVSKVCKVNSDDQKSNSSSSVSSRRASPGSATSSSSHSFDSLLPQPKRLTESVQKLLNFPLDPSTSLPHHRRSPSSCASVTRTTSSSHVTAPCNASTRVSSASGSAPAAAFSMAVTAGTRNLITDAHIDIDSITPSISGVGLGPIVLPIDTSHNVHVDMTIPEHSNMPQLTDTKPVNLSSSYPGAVSSSSTKLVPAVRGSIPSYKSGDSGVSSKPTSASPVSHVNNLASVVNTTSVSTSMLETITDVKTTVCNNDSKMASNSTSVSSVSHRIDSQPTHKETPGPPVLQPQLATNVRYPAHSVSSDKPKSPYQPMGLSEMLQETANIKMTSERLMTTSTSQTTSTELHKPATCHTSSSIDSVISSSGNGPFVEKLKTVEKEPDGRTSENKQILDHNCDESKVLPKSETLTDSGQKNSVDDSDIPKLKRQTNLSVLVGRTNSSSSPVHTPQIGSDSCDSDMGKSQDSCSSTSSTPPVLTAMSDVHDDKHAVTVQDQEDKDSGPIETNQISAKSDIAGEHSKQTLASEKSKSSSIKSSRSQSADTISNNESPPNLIAIKSTVELSEKKINSTVEDVDMSQVMSNIKTVKSSRKRRASSESVEDRPLTEDPDLARRQLRSRKRTNPNENDTSIPEELKRQKLDTGTEISIKTEPKEAKCVTPAPDMVPCEESNSLTETIKSGLRTRTNSKAAQVEQTEKAKPLTGRDSRKDGKVAPGKAVAEKKIVEPVKPEDGKRVPQSRRNRQSPSVQPPEKTAPAPAMREKSPMRVSRSRGRTSPVNLENSEESQDNKRTTRSAKSKETKVEPTSQLQSKAAAAAAAKRRRTSQDHR